MSARWTDQTRADWIKRRPKESALWFTIHTLGSLKLAMVLLFTIGAACAVATVYESNFNTHIAQAYVYKAPWFVFWLALLCLNLLCAAFTRWPWQKKHAGFVITHGGIILLLTGAMVGQKLGFEASVTLHTGEAATNQLVINRNILQVDSPADRSIYTLPFDPELRPPTDKKPRLVAVPGSDLRLLIDQYAPDLVMKTQLLGGPLSAPGGVALSFQSGMMQQHVSVQLTGGSEEASTYDFFGRAKLVLLDALPAREDSATSTTPPLREVQVVLGNRPGQPVTHLDGAQPTGYHADLVSGPAGEPLLRVAPPVGPATDYPLLGAQPGRVPMPGGGTMNIQSYWPDFVMRDGKPGTASEEPRNPAALVEFTLPAALASNVKPLLELAIGPDGQLDYQISRNELVTKRGSVREGEAFALGWADWQATVEKVMPHAVLASSVEPATGEAAPAADGTLPGIRARLVHGRDTGAPAWIGSGRSEVLTFGEERVRIGYGLQLHAVPFRIGLEHFEVPRDEGTDQPSNFISTVKFTDPVSGETAGGRIYMNHPASFPTAFWQTVLGRNYKFSQASWNPQDLGETTLQVLHDPGWPLKWTGSLLICCGIAVLFYFKPKGSKTAGGAGREASAARSRKTATALAPIGR